MLGPGRESPACTLPPSEPKVNLPVNVLLDGLHSCSWQMAPFLDFLGLSPNFCQQNWSTEHHQASQLLYWWLCLQEAQRGHRKLSPDDYSKQNTRSVPPCPEPPLATYPSLQSSSGSFSLLLFTCFSHPFSVSILFSSSAHRVLKQ